MNKGEREMKKILSIILITILTFSLTACSGKDGVGKETVKEPVTTVEESVEQKEQAQPGESSSEETEVGPATEEPEDTSTAEPEETSTAEAPRDDKREAISSMTWEQLTKSNTWEARATQTLEMLEMKVLSKEDIVAMGFREPEDNPHLEMLLITFRHTVENPTIKYSGDEDDRYSYFVSTFSPDISGVEISSGGKLIGAFHDYGFDGSLDDEFDKAWEAKTGNYSSKIKEGDELPKTFTYTGKAIVTIEKDRENFLYTVENRYEPNEKQVTMKIK